MVTRPRVTKPENINYRTFKPERDGRFCARILVLFRIGMPGGKYSGDETVAASFATKAASKSQPE